MCFQGEQVILTFLAQGVNSGTNCRGYLQIQLIRKSFLHYLSLLVLSGHSYHKLRPILAEVFERGATIVVFKRKTVFLNLGTAINSIGK
jgi:hypothetical protein